MIILSHYLDAAHLAERLADDADEAADFLERFSICGDVEGIAAAIVARVDDPEQLAAFLITLGSQIENLQDGGAE